MAVNQPAFRPANAQTSKLACSQSNARAQVQSANNYPHVRLFNAGSVTVYVELGDTNTVTATVGTGDITGTTGSMPIPAGGVEIVSCPMQFVAAICDTGNTSTLWITPGFGL